MNKHIIFNVLEKFCKFATFHMKEKIIIIIMIVNILQYDNESVITYFGI